jgi:GTP-binding protein
MTFTVALVGRPNVGKSTLFNRLSTSRKAIVHDAPGVTRDRQYTDASLGDLDFRLVDTAGLFSLKRREDHLSERAHTQTHQATLEADVIWFMVDALDGITPEDRMIAQSLHKLSKPVILLINKCESKGAQAAIHDFYTLGFENFLALSAEHKEGFVELFQSLLPHVPEETESGEEEAATERPIKLAIVGRPNVGKSTFINQVIGEERLVTSDEAGTTRDMIEVPFIFKDQPFCLMDTAGLRRKSKVVTLLEKQIVDQTREAIQYAECVILMLDATHPLEKQDLTIARQVEEEGRSMVIVLNKKDKVADVNAVMKEVTLEIDRLLSQVRGIPIVAISSLHKKNLSAVFRAVINTHTLWQKRLSTGAVNRWLERALSQNPPPLVNGRSLKIRYATQIKSRPPTFALFVTRAKEFPESYLRYLRNTLREAFDLKGVPIRFLLREQKNPYHEK